jgi:hypothetical protein
MPGTHTYNPATNTITSTGGTSGAPITFNDLWLADKAGVLYLDSRTGISGVDGASDPLTYNLRPADYVLLGGNRNDLYISTAAFSFTTAQSLTAGSRWLSAGTETSGTYADTATDNGTEYVLSEEAADPCLFMSLLYADAVRDSTSISVHIHGYYVGGVGHTVDVSLWNNTTSELDFIGTMPNEAAEQVYTFNAAGTMSDYVSGSDPTGNIEVFFNHVPTDSATPAHELHLDQVIVDTVCAASATVTLIGTDAIGNMQTEDIMVSAGGVSYGATKYFATLTASQVTAFVGVGSFNYNVNQAQWGVVWRQAANQYAFTCNLTIGNGSTATYFTITNVRMIIDAGANTVITVNGAATFQLGTKVSATSGKDGCTLEMQHASTTPLYTYYGRLLFYDSVLTTNTGLLGAVDATKQHEIIQCTFKGWQVLRVAGATSIIYDVRMQNGNTYGLNTVGTLGTVEKIRVQGQQYGVYFAPTYGDSVLKDLSTESIVTNDVLVYTWDASVANAYLINCALSTWGFTHTGTHPTVKVYRQYTYDLQVLDSAGAAVNGAIVTLTDNTLANVFSVATAASGSIATQTVSRGYYNQANGNTLQDYGPFHLTITKAGYATYTHNDIVLDEKTDWRVALQTEAEDALTPPLTGDASPSDVTRYKTFYNTDATTKLTGTMNLPLPTKPRTIIKRVENPADEALLMATGVLLVRNRQLKRKLKEYKK